MTVRRYSSVLILLMSLAGYAQAASVDDILEHNARALGGNAAFDRIENLRLTLDIREPTFAVNATYVATREGQMRIDITMEGERVMTEAFNGTRAWAWSPDAGVTESGAAGSAALRHGIESPGRIWTLQQLRERGTRIELLDPGPLAQPHEWQLRLTRKDGATVDWFIDRTSFLPTREVSRRAFHPDVDATESSIETAFSEPEWTDGVLRFRREDQHNLDTGEWLGTTETQSVENNVELAVDYFEPE